MIRLSASLIKDFLVCPARAYYRINYPEAALASREMVIGTIVHEVLEKYWTDQDTAVMKASELIRANNLTSGDDLIYKCIYNFFKMYPDFFSTDDIVEKFFSYPYKDGISIVGKMDRIHNNVVYDWKTGARPPEDVNKDPQFILYYLAYKRLFSKEPSALVYASLQNKKMYTFEPDKAIVNEFENVILPMVFNRIVAKDFPRTGLFGYKACQYCSFSDICYRELGTEE